MQNIRVNDCSPDVNATEKDSDQTSNIEQNDNESTNKVPSSAIE